MIVVERDIVLPVTVDEAVSYLEDFRHAERWDPGTVRCVRVGEGPVRPGAEWRNTSRFNGRTTELLYRLDVREPARLVFVGTNTSVTATDDMRFEARGDGTVLLRYRASLRFKGLAKLATPFLRAEFEKLADRVARRLPAAVTEERNR